MSKVITFIKGMIIGFGKIIPGVSGSMFALLFGVYEDIISIFINPKNIKNKINVIGPLFIGIIFAIILGSSLIKVLLEKYYVESMFFFIGMMVFGIIPLIKEVKSSKITKKQVLISILATFFVCLLFFIDIGGEVSSTNNIFYMGTSLILCGILDAGSTVIPGISGTALLMLLGYYNIIITSLANPLKITSICILIPFLIGFLIGLYIFSKIINMLLTKYENCTKMTIIGFAIFSILTLLLSTYNQVTIKNILPLVIVFMIGFILSLLLENSFKS